MTEKPSLTERLSDKYANHAVLRGLVQAVPFGGAVETAFLTYATNLKERRVERFFGALASGDLKPTDEVIRTDQFVHRYLTTLAAAVRTYRMEKIDLFAEYLRNGTTTQIGEDEFDELLQILDELSFRELMVLETLDQYENETPRIPAENDLRHSNRFWEQFESRVVAVTHIEPDSFAPFMARLARTGTFEPFTGTYWDYKGGQGKITPLYRRLRALCVKRD